MRILIVGGGVAGLTLAALVRRNGDEPVVIDRRVEGAADGYALALWPHGSRVFHALGIHDAFVARSEPMARYVATDGQGRTLNASELPATISRYGHLGAIPRSELVDLLGSALGDVEVRSGIGIERLTQMGERVDVGLSDGSDASVDLVVGADGISSRVRELLFGRVAERATGWGCYVWWARPDLVPSGETTERWGVGSFLGTYPCRQQVCVILGAPIDALRPHRIEGRTDRLAALLEPYGVPVDEFLGGLPDDTQPLYLWRMADVRAPAWVKGRVALVGDAAAAFLPTAGIGASMALESAAVLADELSRTDANYLTNALDLYVKRRRDRVHAAQDQSRRLARLMFLRSARLARMRDRALRFASMERMVGPLIKDLRNPI